ncbi:unnamed protein product [Urochloa humidicola]
MTEAAFRARRAGLAAALLLVLVVVAGAAALAGRGSGSGGRALDGLRHRSTEAAAALAGGARRWLRDSSWPAAAATPRAGGEDDGLATAVAGAVEDPEAVVEDVHV